MRSPSAAAESPLTRRAQPWLGTLVEISIAAQHSPATTRAIDGAFSAIARVHARMSYHDPASELSHLNRHGLQRSIRVSRPLSRVLRAALLLARESNGAFDPTIAPVLAGWGLLPRLAGRTGKERRASWRDVELTFRGVRFLAPLHLDLGGIAKGFAVDEAIQSLRRSGIRSAIVNAGGDLRALGPCAWPVQIRHPANPGVVVAEIALQGAALATSAHYFSRRRWRGRVVSALLDGRDRRPAGDDLRSVTVEAKNALLADGLTKVVFAFGSESDRILDRHGARALILGEGEPLELGRR